MIAATFAAGCLLSAPAADEYAFAFRIRVNEPLTFAGNEAGGGKHLAYGLRLRSSGTFGSSPFVFKATSAAGVLGARGYETYIEAETNPGAWHHVAFTFSKAKKEARAYFDGVGQQAWTLGDKETFDEKALKKLAPGEGFPGEVTGFKTFDKVPEFSELMAGDIPAAEVAAAKSAFEKAAAEAGVAPAFAAWCRECAKKAAAIGAGKDLGAWHRLETLRLRLPKLLPLAKTKVATEGMLPFRINRYWNNKHLPYAVPADATPLEGVLIAGAKGEWDCDSFMVHPFADAKDFHLKPTDLKGPDGAVVKASEVDVRVVKCWYQCGAAFNTYFPAGRGQILLCPEMLLHDDDFMRVDTERRLNNLRLSYPDETLYVNQLEVATEEHITKFNINAEPVLDAKEFQPMNLAEGWMRQFWLTVKLPEDRVPGDYTGSLEVSVGGKTCGTIPLTVRIYPFALPWPSPHYDIDKPMLHGYLAHTGFREMLGGGGYSAGYPHWGATVKRRDAMIRNMVEHGFGNVEVCTYSGDESTWDISDADAVLLKRNGAQLKPLLGDFGIDMEFVSMTRNPPKGKTDFSVEGNWEVFCHAMTVYSNMLARAQEKLKATYGHTQVVCYGADEAGPETVRREFPFFATQNHFGSLSYTSQGRPEPASFMTDWDGCPQSIHRDTAHSWHAAGAVLTTYAVPHGGPENPDLWRRRKGLHLWFADFDGQREYIWFEGANIWNDFVLQSQYKCFDMVQPTFDGVIDSIQWEANREGIDDMRYATLLKRACRAARATGEPKLVKAGREFDAWLELSDYEKGDLEELRAKMAKRISVLLKALAAKGVDVAKFSPPLPEKQNLPLPKPYDLDGDGYAKRNMLDLACEAWEKDGKEESLFKSVNAHIVLRETAAAAKVLDRIENDAATSPAGKARAKLRRGLLGLTKTKHIWVPTKEALQTAKQCFDFSVKHDLARVGVGELGTAADKLMRAFSAVGDHENAIAVGETLAGPLKKALGGWNAPIKENDTYVFIGNEYFALKKLKRAIEWFQKCGRYYDALIRLGDAAKALEDYPTAMAAYTDATTLLDPVDGKFKIDAIRRQVGEISKMVRKNTKQSVSEDMMRNSDSDDDIGGLSLDD